jgi:diguanylate cyclase (GGDEF)-like protein
LQHVADGVRSPDLTETGPDGGGPLDDDAPGHTPPAPASPGYGDISAAWLLGRARELVAVTQRSSPDSQHEIVEELDDLLGETLRRQDPMAVGQMLRSAVLARLAVPEYPGERIDPLLDELLSHARRHGAVILEAGAHVLRGRRSLLEGADDTAVAELALALAMLDEEPVTDPTHGQRGGQRLLSAVLVDSAMVLTKLGVYGEADRVMARADGAVRFGGGPHEISVHLFNRVRLQLAWALRLERVGDDRAAADRIAVASAMAADAEGPFQESLFPRHADLAAADQITVLGAAHALAGPGPRHIPRLRRLLDVETAETPDVIMAGIALSRCLAAAGDTEEALAVLADVREQVAPDNSEAVLRLSLVREYARLSGPDGGERTTSALEGYANELEGELWAALDSRTSMLSARREHERLTREHGAISIQAKSDPLTGLPNRRALDERLAELMAEPSSHPVAIALVDLDGFKNVNDQASHAEGDDVLRAVAATLRNALRGDDMVARYGGDEFVALLPGAPLSAAEAALNRAARKVEGLPKDLSHGVTLSVGVVSLRPHESAADVLTRADAAMYQAKRGGGNSVAAITGVIPQIHDTGTGSGGRGAEPGRRWDSPATEPGSGRDLGLDPDGEYGYGPVYDEDGVTGRTWVLPDTP